MNQSPARVVEPLENAVNEGIVQAKTENDYTFGKIVYLPALKPCWRVNTSALNSAVLRQLQHRQRNIDHGIYEFREVESFSRYYFPKLKFSKDSLALVAYLNVEILPLYLQSESTMLQVQIPTYCVDISAFRTLGKKQYLETITPARTQEIIRRGKFIFKMKLAN